MKKNIVAIIGSLNESSKTEIIIERVLHKLNILDRDYNIKFIRLKEYNINYCKGCQKCFCSGYCKLDLVDEMSKIRYELKNANIIIFSSPVYGNNVSGIMKTIIDRLMYETHILSFAGKLGFTISTTDASGGEEINKYLKDIMQNLGIKILSKYTITLEEIYNKGFEDLTYRIAFDIKDKLANNIGYSNIFLEETFKMYKRINKYRKNEYIKNEIEYWNRNWILETYSFQEYAKKMLHINSKL